MLRIFALHDLSVLMLAWTSRNVGLKADYFLILDYITANR
jgi:hypothetical protein